MADRDDYWFFQSRTAPPPLAGPQGEAWWLLWGHTKDAWREGCREASKASLPLLAAPDSLEAYAAERSTEPYPSEGQATFRVRLTEQFDRWTWGGTPQGVFDAVAETTGVLSVGYFESWQWDPGNPLWARFWLVVDTVWQPPEVFEGGGVFDDGTEIFDIDAPPEDVEFLFRQVLRWKAAHAQPQPILALVNGAHVFDDGTIDFEEVGLIYDTGEVIALEVS
jgi:hypothetical protein